MSEEEDTKALCPHCKSVNWNVENVLNTTDYKGLIQAECNDCGQHFEFEAKNVSAGWTQIPFESLRSNDGDE